MKKLLFVISILYSSFCYSAPHWSGSLSVETVFTENSDIIVITTGGGVVESEGCIANKWIFRGTSEERRNRGFSALMAALMAEKTVQFWVTDNCDSWNYHSLTAVKVIK